MPMVVFYHLLTRSFCLQLMHKHTLAVLSDALTLWPTALVKLHYIEKLLTANLAANMDPPPALVTGLQVMSEVRNTCCVTWRFLAYLQLNMPRGCAISPALSKKRLAGAGSAATSICAGQRTAVQPAD